MFWKVFACLARRGREKIVRILGAHSGKTGSDFYKDVFFQPATYNRQHAIVSYNSSMIANPHNEPVWVSRPADLRNMVADLHRFTRIAVDTESNGLYVYQEQVCLLQFSTGETDYLVDPLAIADLSILESFFEDPAIEKIFHAAEYDILCLKRDFGFHFANLFDTMLAARILGRKDLGLGHLLATEFELDLDKRHQRANWGRRPLPQSMLSYARLDTHYLIDLRDRLYEALSKKDLLALAHEDFMRMCQTPSAPLAAQVDTCWSIATPKDVDPRQAAVLQELCEFRDRQARYSNQPTFRILPNRSLIDIARHNPLTLDALDEVPGLPGKTVERYGNGIIAAVERGQTTPILHAPHNHRPPEALIRRLEKLRDWRKETARRLEIESDIVLPKDILTALAETNPQTLEGVAQVMETLPWRFAHYGQEIFEIIHPDGKKPA